MNSFHQESSAPLDDIPEARREVLVTQGSQQSTFNRGWLVLLALGLVISGGLVWFLLARPLATAKEGDAIAPTASTQPTPETGVDDQAQSSVAEPEAKATEGTEAGSTAQVSAASVTGTTVPSGSEVQTLLGHREYAVADAGVMVVLSENAQVKLKPVAAQKVEAMIAQARAEGVKLGVVSGFRTLEDQRRLFFDVKADRGQNASTRAEVSAPPGYSEHHTGYAVDFVDRNYPDTDLETDFEKTPAFRWLQENAAHYGFEMSFSKNNEAQVSYEPWHWRFTGDQESLETFYKE